MDLRQEGGDWLVVAVADVPVGAELFHPYGVRGRQDMFSVRGFSEWARDFSFKTASIHITPGESAVGRGGYHDSQARGRDTRKVLPPVFS